MRSKKSTLLSWSIAVLSTGLLIFASLVNGFQDDQDLPLLVFLVYLVVGGLVASRHPANAVGWLFLSGIFIHSTNGIINWYADLGLRVHPGSLPGADVVAALMNGMGNLGFGLLFFFPILLFPNGQLLSRRWRPVAWLAGLLLVLQILETFRPGPLVYFSDLENPLGIGLLEGYFEFITTWGDFLFTPVFLACSISLVLRYRRAHAAERQQIKWVAYAAGLAGLVTGLMLVVSPFLHTAEIWLNLVFLFLVASVPLSIGIAILRYRLWDIDLIIRRTLIYSLLTAVLAMVYLGSVVLLQNLFVAFSGQESPLAVVVSTLAIAALFTPLRRRIQDAIDRRFYRRKYDAARALESFATSVRDQTDVQRLTTELVRVVQETLEPEQIVLWTQPTISNSKIHRSELIAGKK